MAHTNKRGCPYVHLYKVLHGLKTSWARPITSLCAPVGLDDIFDCPPADGAACIGHLFEFEATGVAETHVSTGIEDCVHHILVANGAFITPWTGAGREGGGLWLAGEWRAWRCTLRGVTRRYERYWVSMTVKKKKKKIEEAFQVAETHWHYFTKHLQFGLYPSHKLYCLH